MRLSMLSRRSTGGERSAMGTVSRVQFSGVGRRSTPHRSRGIGSALVSVASSERSPLTREMSVTSQSTALAGASALAIKQVQDF